MRTGVTVLAIVGEAESKQAFRRWAMLAATLLVWGWLVLSAGAQDMGFKSGVINPDFDTRPDPSGMRDRRIEQERRQRYGDRQRLVAEIFAGRAALADNQAAFDQWFNEVVFPSMVPVGDAELAELASRREDLFKVVQSGGNPEAVQRFATTLALPFFRGVATDNYHPAARVNAVTVVGRLDSRTGRGRDAAPEPLAEALPVLLGWLGDASLPEYVRVTSLYGIERHCTIAGQAATGMDEAMRGQVLAALLPLLGEAPADRSPEATYWMKRLACRALGGLRELGNNAEVATALKGVVKDESAALLIRCDAVVAYGKLRFADPTQAQALDVALEVAKIASKASRSELEHLTSSEADVKLALQFQGTGAGGIGGVAGGAPGGDLTGSAPRGPASAGGGGGAGASADLGAGSGASAGIGGGVPGGGSIPGGSFPGGSFPGGFGAGVSTTDLPVYRFRVSQRRLMTVLYHLREAMKVEGDGRGGLSTLAPSDAKVTEVSTALDELMVAAQTGLSDKETDSFGAILKRFRDDVEKKAAALDRLQPVAEEAGGDTDAFGGM